MLSRSSPTRSLFRFHRAAGARVALRASIMGACVLVFIFGSSPELAYTTYRFVLSVASRDAAPGAGTLLGVVAIGLALQAEGRMRAGLGGWMRTLPASALHQRRALCGALIVAQAPVLVVAGVCAAAAALGYRAQLDPARLAAIPLVTIGAAYAAMRVARGWLTRPAAAAAALLVTRGEWWALAVAAAALVMVDRAAGPLRPARSAARRGSAVRGIELRLVWRALGARGVLAGAPALLPLAFVYFFRANNDLAPEAAALAARVGGALSAVVFAALLANALNQRRAPWPWIRSLPWSSLRRVGADALAIALPGVPLMLLAGWMEPAAALFTALSLACSSCIAAGAILGARERKSGAAGETILVGTPVAVLIALYPTAWPLAPAAALAALWTAGRRARASRSLRWAELHHTAEGDSAWQGAA